MKPTPISGIAEIAGFLAVIAGEHTEAARVNGQRLVQRKLRGEVGDRTRGIGIAMLPPRVARGPGAHRARQPPHRRRGESARSAAARSSISCETCCSISTGLWAVCRHNA